MAGRGYNYYYYFHRETGECRWEYPTETTSSSQADGIEVAAAVVAATTAVGASSGGDVASSPSATVVKKSILKRSSVDDQPSTTTTSPNNTMDDSSNINNDENETSSSTVRNNNKRARVDNNEPREVRVLHILRKHIHSRRPSSWRVPNITDTKEKAISDLLELQSILLDISDPKELRATFEEFAKTESDCSSAKRGGDLGFFGRKKMQPAFEKASFSLGVGQMTSDIVDTSSGVHLILRLA
jgi:NIMA-interacting peptidyl-prolyl cis-trans isomerase 1